ncbi:MAG: hypothetical protein PHY54_12465 [Methylococcales bacterium]|nr:hypothetical protein [Methylococcales bacterium]
MESKLILAAAIALAMTAASAAQASIVNYNVQETFMEPAYGGNQNTVFNGTFVYDTEAKTIISMTGALSEAMTAGLNGGVQKLLNLNFNPAASSSDGNGGVTASAFLLNTTSIYSDGAFNTTALMKQSGIANAYATIYVSAAQLSGLDPLLSAASFGNLFYGDCQPGGMMGPMCMTGFGDADNGGSMGGYPISERVSAVPLPPVVWTFLSGMIGFLFLGKQRKTL